MTEFVDVEAMVLAFIRGYTDVKVGTKVPTPRPARFVRAWANGGGALNRVLERVTITVDVWAASSVDASLVAGTIRHGFLNDYTAMPLVRGVEEVSRPTYTPDETSDRYRFTVALMVRAKR